MQQDDGTFRKFDDRAISDAGFAAMVEEHPELVFHVGEEVKVKGGDFRVRSIGRRMLILEGLPGTRINKS